MIMLLSAVLYLIVVEVWSGIKRKDGYVVSPNTLAIAMPFWRSSGLVLKVNVD